MESEKQRIYHIYCSPSLTEEDFNAHYTLLIRDSNAIFPDCLYIIDDKETDRLSNNFLRSIGISPDRITIYQCIGNPVFNPHGYNIQITNNQSSYDSSTHSTHYISPTISTIFMRDMKKIKKIDNVFSSIYVP